MLKFGLTVLLLTAYVKAQASEELSRLIKEANKAKPLVADGLKEIENREDVKRNPHMVEELTRWREKAVDLLFRVHDKALGPLLEGNKVITKNELDFLRELARQDMNEFNFWQKLGGEDIVGLIREDKLPDQFKKDSKVLTWLTLTLKHYIETLQAIAREIVKNPPTSQERKRK